MGSVYVDKRSKRSVFGIAYQDVDGRRRQERVKASSRELARRLLIKKQDDVALAKSKGLKSVDNLAPKPSKTFKAYVEGVFLPHVKANKTARTHKVYTRVLKDHACPRLGGMAMDAITTADIQDLVTERRNTDHAAARTVVSEWGILSAIFSLARKNGQLTANPCKGVTYPKIDDGPGRRLSPAEVNAMMAHAEPRLKLAIVFALETAMRCSEIRGLTWADYNKDQGTVTVRLTKNHQNKTIPLSPAALGVMESCEAIRGTPSAASSPYVFLRSTGERWNIHFTGTSEWRRLRRRSGVKCRFHDFRVSAITSWLCKRHPLEAVRQLAGHSNIEQTAAYCRLVASDLRAVTEESNYQVRCHDDPKTSLSPPVAPLSVAT